jgi:hypothetical protein
VSYTNFYICNFHIVVVTMGLNKSRWFTLIDGLKSIKIGQVNRKQFIVLKLSIFIFLLLHTFKIFLTFYYFDYVLLLMFLPTHIYFLSQFTYSICTCAVLKMLLTKVPTLFENVVRNFLCIQSNQSTRVVPSLERSQTWTLYLKKLCRRVRNHFWMDYSRYYLLWCLQMFLLHRLLR